MILVDANILLYAEDESSEHHRIAKTWWDQKLSETFPVCLCWPTINAYLRISTNSRVYQNPLTLDQATKRVESWMKQPCVRLIHSTPAHWEIFRKMMKEGQARANLVPDAHLAALAIENGCVLYSFDADFSRFPDLKWKNPLKVK
jgi:toxin-antitoxin system PIN domain toxin